MMQHLRTEVHFDLLIARLKVRLKPFFKRASLCILKINTKQLLLLHERSVFDITGYRWIRFFQ